MLERSKIRLSKRTFHSGMMWPCGMAILGHWHGRTPAARANHTTDVVHPRLPEQPSFVIEVLDHLTSASWMRVMAWHLEGMSACLQAGQSIILSIQDRGDLVCAE